MIARMNNELLITGFRGPRVCARARRASHTHSLNVTQGFGPNKNAGSSVSKCARVHNYYIYTNARGRLFKLHAYAYGFREVSKVVMMMTVYNVIYYVHTMYTHTSNIWQKIIREHVTLCVVWHRGGL